VFEVTGLGEGKAVAYTLGQALRALGVSGFQIFLKIGA
jgi:hypothetical protein